MVTVCVTGSSGYIASYLVKLLLLRGYTVHATVRNPDDEAKTEHLKALEGANDRLRLFKADLMEEGSFDSAIAGCQGGRRSTIHSASDFYIFHTASPVNFNVIDPKADVLDPAVKGTLNVLAACKRNPSVKRVVLTSSMGTVIFSGLRRTPDIIVDESWFSNPQNCDEMPQLKWYHISKIEAEEAASKFCEEHKIDMVVILPGTVIGPMLQPKLNATPELILNLINGAETYLNLALPWVHIKDVAEAHVRAFEIPSAHGRYCIVDEVVHHSDVLKLLHKLYPTIQLPKKCVDEGELVKTYQVSKTKAKSLGIENIPLEVSLKDTVEDIIERKYPIPFRT